MRRAVGTKKQAEALERQIITEHTNGTLELQHPDEILFHDFVPQYLEHAVVNKAEKAHREERYTINAYLLPYFGDRPLSQIDERLVERYKMSRQRAGVSPRTINLELTLLSVMFRLAILRKCVRRNPLA